MTGHPERARPWWVGLLLNQGIAALILLYLIGLIPGTQSPLLRFFQDHEALASNLSRHEQTTAELLRTNRLICRGVWRNEPNVQDQCGQP